MSSSAETVFAIPELLEHILLYVHGTSQVPDIQLSKALFSLQRVNKSFNATIQGSRRLLWRMGIASPLDSDAELAAKQDLITPYLKRKEFKVGPFKYDEVQYHKDEGCARLWLSILADGLDSSASEHGASIGLLGRSRILYTSTDHTWQQLFFTFANCTEIVEIFVKFRDPFKQDGENFSEYSEWLFKPRYRTDGKITLGKIADMLSGIKRRTLFQHKALSIFKPHQGDDSAWNHGAAERFLQRVPMYIAWMRFEPQSALQRLQRTDHHSQLFLPTRLEELEDDMNTNRRLAICQAYIDKNNELIRAIEFLLAQQAAAAQGMDFVLTGMGAIIYALTLWSAYIVVAFWFFQ